MSKRNYRCFFCGESSATEVEVVESCVCGFSYDYILKNFPKTIGSYKVERSLSRGFYGATFLAKKGSLGLLRVIKITPVFFYSNRTISFKEETENHVRAADGAEFIVSITDDPTEQSIQFGNHQTKCHCTEMEYVDGYALSDIHSGKMELSPETAVQISCDLLSILNELYQRRLNHNDLHAGNIIIEKLKISAHRAGAVNRSIKAKAIDLGSVDTQRREGEDYLSDTQWIASHLLAFSEILSRTNDSKSDIRARVAFALHRRALELKTPVAKQSDQPIQDLIDDILRAYNSATKKFNRGWHIPFALSSFSAHRNAQTLDSWYVPRLMVDPTEKWLAEIHSGGPVVITGMRGCGKTMLLRSLQLHARIISSSRDSSNANEQKSLLIKDGYLGVFASARHLGYGPYGPSGNGADKDVVSDFFARLFIVYAMAICDALVHLEEVHPGSVADSAPQDLGQIVFGQLGRPNPLVRESSLDDFQSHLVLDAELWSGNFLSDKLIAEPWSAFVLLAKSVQNTLQNIGSPQILFLLDDVSTRYLKPRQIESVVSTLLLQDPACAFKITSETQTFFLSIKSPAQINLASDERDYTSFDLGSKVLEQLKDSKRGETFLSEILKRRMLALGGDFEKLTPKAVLGDKPLAQIARDICAGSASKPKEKNIYHGFSALRGVCIGDLGSVIALFQEILNHSADGILPVPTKKQHQVYEVFCSNQLFQLNNRDGKQNHGFSLKKIALEFAEASYEEMIDSCVKEKDRIRQITSMYVTLEEGNKEQAKKLLELVDAGIFAMHPNKLSTRVKNTGADPVLQFQLSFRKILGISKLIGLSDRDRFELSGSEMLQWLSGQGGKKMLRAHTRRFSPSEDSQAASLEQYSEAANTPAQELKQSQMELVYDIRPQQTESPSIPVPKIEEVDFSNIGRIDTLVVSLGFEERCFPSADRLARQTKPKHIIAVKFDIPGELEKAQELAKDIGSTFEVINSDKILEGSLIGYSGSTLIDCSGLTKPVIFRLVKGDFQDKGMTFFAITEPEEYSPTEDDLTEAIGGKFEFWGDDGVECLSSILNGEKLPYSLLVVEELNSDPSRNKKLCSFASAKHGRLIHLVEQQAYDEIDIFVQEGNTSRNAVARKAASIATGGGEMGSIINYKEDDPQELLARLFQNHFITYSSHSSNFEIGLTGGKIEAVLSGVMGACLPINRVLYVKPKKFDPSSFSVGFGSTKIYRITR